MKMSQLRLTMVMITGEKGKLWENFVTETYRIHKRIPAYSLHHDFEADSRLLCFITFVNNNF